MSRPGAPSSADEDRTQVDIPRPQRVQGKSGSGNDPEMLLDNDPALDRDAPTQINEPSLSSIRMGRKLLGDRLVEANLISPDELNLSLREQQRAGGKLGEVLERLGFVQHNIISSILAQDAGSDMVELDSAIIYPEGLELIPYREAKRRNLIPLAVEGEMLLIAMGNTYDVVAIDAIQRRTGKDVQVVAATPRDVDEAIERAYNTTASIEDTIDLLLADGDDVLDEAAVSEAPMVRLADQILMLAVRERATDIHIEPDELVVRIRFRVDGTIRQATVIPNVLKLALIAVFKIKSGMDITEKRIPQDGRTSFQVGQRKIDVRVSSLPTKYGENMVMRLLDKGAMTLQLDALDLSRRDRRLVSQAMDGTYGMVIVTGPTGSGKTTTLYSALDCVNALERSVFTLEDPIEYDLPIIRQTQINDDIGLTFASGLRTLLRQDPDVIMLGEMRDTETAQMAVRAALTGHLVLSTLHANTAIAAIPRLIDMDVEPYLLAAAQPLLIGQRLGRRLCETCREPVADAQAVLEAHSLPIPANDDFKLYTAHGCERCDGAGYRGRVAFYEMARVTQAFNEAIVNNDMPVLESLARAEGYRSMREDGLRKAMAGLTSVEEVLRVVSS